MDEALSFSHARKDDGERVVSILLKVMETARQYGAGSTIKVNTTTERVDYIVAPKGSFLADW